LSPTPLPELDEEYEARCDDEDMDPSRMRHWEEDLILCNRLEMEERNLNLRARL
jgi:hypothetical protein